MWRLLWFLRLRAGFQFSSTNFPAWIPTSLSCCHNVLCIVLVCNHRISCVLVVGFYFRFPFGLTLPVTAGTNTCFVALAEGLARSQLPCTDFDERGKTSEKRRSSCHTVALQHNTTVLKQIIFIFYIFFRKPTLQNLILKLMETATFLSCCRRPRVSHRRSVPFCSPAVGMLQLRYMVVKCLSPGSCQSNLRTPLPGRSRSFGIGSCLLTQPVRPVSPASFLL